MGFELKKIDNIALQVDDVNKSVEWYVEKYECEVLYNDDTWALLQFDNIKVALVVEEEHPFHIAFEIDGLDGEGKNWKYRRDNSISRYIEDPSGNKIELIWYMNQERK